MGGLLDESATSANTCAQVTATLRRTLSTVATLHKLLFWLPGWQNKTLLIPQWYTCQQPVARHEISIDIGHDRYARQDSTEETFRLVWIFCTFHNE